MTSSSKLDDAFAPEHSLFGNDFSICEEQGPKQRSVRVLERLAATLGVPVEAFFAETATATPSNEATAAEIAALTRAFVAIKDPVMRRYCLDVIGAAGLEEPAGSQSAEPA